jgi:threonine/homoserine/homoserine lactone efflux protein
VILIIGILGVSVLFYFGTQIILDIKKNRIDVSFLEQSSPKGQPNHSEESKISIEEPTEVLEPEKTSPGQNRLYSKHPLFGSMLFLASNPYWWLWWATAGLKIILDNDVSFDNPTMLWGLLIGKELGVFLWYTFVGGVLGASSHLFNKKIYVGILLVCGLFMAGYGMYLLFAQVISFF